MVSTVRLALYGKLAHGPPFYYPPKAIAKRKEERKKERKKNTQRSSKSQNIQVKSDIDATQAN